MVERLRSSQAFGFRDTTDYDRRSGEHGLRDRRLLIPTRRTLELRAAGACGGCRNHAIQLVDASGFSIEQSIKRFTLRVSGDSTATYEGWKNDQWFTGKACRVFPA